MNMIKETLVSTTCSQTQRGKAVAHPYDEPSSTQFCFVAGSSGLVPKHLVARGQDRWSGLVDSAVLQPCGKLPLFCVCWYYGGVKSRRHNPARIDSLTHSRSRSACAHHPEDTDVPPKRGSSQDHFFSFD